MLCSRILFGVGNQATGGIIKSSTLIRNSVSRSSQSHQIKRFLQLSADHLAKEARSSSKIMALPKVFFDVTANGSPVGRIEMEVSTGRPVWVVCFSSE